MKAILSFIILMLLINFMHGQTSEKPEIIEPLYEGPEAPLKIKKPLLEGNQVVEIYFQEAVIHKLRVGVSSGEIKEYTDLSNNQQKATLDQPLVVGQEVVVEGFNENGEKVWIEVIVVQSSTLDWGFQRVFFNFGSILSKKKNEFSEADLYLDFELHSHWTPHFISFAKFQFTSLPALESNDGNPDDPQNDNNQENGNGVDQFIKSRKGVTFQVGMFFPDILPFKFLKRTWDSPGYKNKIFAAPLIKAGFHTYAEDIDNQDSQDDFFTFFSFGFRFGHLKVLNHERTAPKLESYLDVTLGWSDNIGAVRDEEEDKQPYDRFNNTFNVYFEARLNIPKTPFILGFDAYFNWRKGRTRDDDEAVKVAVPDDLRFFIGTRIDITSIISKLIPGK
ncbi:MAG: hypothetical protein PVH61_12455 [Candidatus Aminicenantes bacterium]